MIQHTLILSSVRFQIFCESVSSCLVFESSYNCGVNLQIECAQQIIKRFQNQILIIATSLTALWIFNGQNAKEVHQYIVFSKPLRICHIKTYFCWSHSKWMTRAHNPFIPNIITPKQMMSSGFVLYLFQKIKKRPIIFLPKKGFSPIKNNETKATNPRPWENFLTNQRVVVIVPGSQQEVRAEYIRRVKRGEWSSRVNMGSSRSRSRVGKAKGKILYN